MIAIEKLRLAILLKRRPVAANDAVVSDDGLEDSAVVVGVVTVLGREHDIPTLVADKVFVVRWDQKELFFPETPCAAIVSQIEVATFPPFDMNGVAQKLDAFAAVADVQP